MSEGAYAHHTGGLVVAKRPCRRVFVAPAPRAPHLSRAAASTGPRRPSARDRARPSRQPQTPHRQPRRDRAARDPRRPRTLPLIRGPTRASSGRAAPAPP